jgi:hypothetical protein
MLASIIRQNISASDVLQLSQRNQDCVEIERRTQ